MKKRRNKVSPEVPVATSEPDLRAIGLIAVHTLAIPAIVFGILSLLGSGYLCDVQRYFEFSHAMAHGKLPYRDFGVEYPPLSLLPVILPQWLSGNSLDQFGLYCMLFLCETIGLSTLTAVVLLKIARKQDLGLPPAQIVGWYVALALVAAPLVPWRYDLLPVFLTALALLGFASGSPALVGISLALGALAKLYPGVLLPAFFGAYAVSRQPRAWQAMVGAAVATAVVVLVPVMGATNNQVWTFLRPHVQRGLQVESVPAGVLLIAHRVFGLNLSLVSNYGADHLVSPVADALSKACPFVVLTLLAWASANVWRSFHREKEETGQIAFDSVVRAACLLLVVFVVFNKVFSTQYIAWFFPLVPFLRKRERVLFAAACVLTTVVSPFLFNSLLRLELLPILLINVRNGLLLAMGVSLWRSGRPRASEPALEMGSVPADVRL